MKKIKTILWLSERWNTVIKISTGAYAYICMLIIDLTSMIKKFLSFYIFHPEHFFCIFICVFVLLIHFYSSNGFIDWFYHCKKNNSHINEMHMVIHSGSKFISLNTVKYLQSDFFFVITLSFVSFEWFTFKLIVVFFILFYLCYYIKKLSQK